MCCRIQLCMIHGGVQAIFSVLESSEVKFPALEGFVLPTYFPSRLGNLTRGPGVPPSIFQPNCLINRLLLLLVLSCSQATRHHSQCLFSSQIRTLSYIPNVLARAWAGRDFFQDNQRRRNHEGKKKMDADFIKIVEETKVLFVTEHNAAADP